MKGVTAGLLKGFEDIREFYRVTGELLDKIRAVPDLWAQIPEQLHSTDLSNLLANRPKLDFVPYFPIPQPWAGRSSTVLLNRLSNSVERPSLLPEEMDEPFIGPSMLNWATAACSILAAREHGIGIPRTDGIKPSDLNRLARLLASSGEKEEKFRRFMEMGRVISGNGSIRQLFLTVPVPRVETIKNTPQGMTPDLDQPFQRNLALSAVADFVGENRRENFSSEQAEEVYDASRHTILQEQRLLACQTSWLATISHAVPIQLRPSRGNVPGALRALQNALEKGSKKCSELFRTLEIELAASLPSGIVSNIFEKAVSVTLFSDYPYEWTLCDKLPLCLRHPTSRVPLSMSSWDTSSAAILDTYQLTPNRPDKVLILDLIEKDDLIRPYTDAFLRSSSNIGNKFSHVTPKDAAEIREILTRVKPEIVVIDSHGRYETRQDEVSIKIQDSWCRFSDLLPDPPISPVWIVSACDTAQSEALRGCVVRSLLRRGAYTVIATLARVDALIASMLVGRLLADIYQPIGDPRERSISEIFFGTQLTTALTYDPLLPLLHKAETDKTLHNSVNQMRLAFVNWTHGRPIDLDTYHYEIANKLSEFLVSFGLYDLHRNLEAAGHVRPETLLFSIFGFPDRVII